MCSIGIAHPRPESFPAREEVSRSLSAKSAHSHRVFRASDLVIGEVLGRGFYGQAVKVSEMKQLTVSNTWEFTISICLSFVALNYDAVNKCNIAIKLMNLTTKHNYTVSDKKVNLCIQFHNFHRQCRILTKFHNSNATSNGIQITKVQ